MSLCAGEGEAEEGRARQGRLAEAADLHALAEPAFWMIPGTSKIWSKSGPVTLLTIAKMLQKIQETMDTYYFCQFGTHNISIGSRKNIS